MAISVAVPVTDAVADALIDKLVPQIEALKIGPASDKATEMGPLVTQAAKDRANHYVSILVKQQGAKIVVDGRGFPKINKAMRTAFMSVVACLIMSQKRWIAIVMRFSGLSYQWCAKILSRCC